MTTRNLYLQARKSLIKGMKPFNYVAAILCITLLSAISGHAQTTVPYAFTGAMQTFTVPAGVTSIVIDAGGSVGGYNSNWPSGTYPSEGGNGGRVQCTLNVTPGDVLQINVGGSGGNGVGAVGGVGGYNGGGSGNGSGSYSGGGGGGASDIRVSPYGLANRVVVAAGGGGAGLDNPGTNKELGGAGGDLVGMNGYFNGNNTGGNGGYGGTQSAGGMGGPVAGGNGLLGTGGDAAGASASGGGGGGYYGGGGGGNAWTGGGGGSSYTDPVAVTSFIHTQGYNNGDGYITLTYSISIPTITSISPSVGYPASSVTITGTNFDATPANNIVYFGATQATVTAAGTTSLTVTVPTGGTFGPVSVTNITSGLTAYSTSYFLQDYNNSAYVPGIVNFDPYVNYAANSDLTVSSTIADIDGDGKPDIVDAFYTVTTGTISVLRNTGTSGAITGSSFAASMDFPGLAGLYAVTTGDVDGDGKPDIIVSYKYSFAFSVFRNTSTPGSISFDARVDFPASATGYAIAVGDLDGDGRIDVAIGTAGGYVAAFQNTAIPGAITAGSFAAEVDYSTSSVISGLAIGDIDGDGKPELLATDQSTDMVSALRNTSTLGTLDGSSFAAYVDFAAGTGPQGIALGDIDGDGKLDMAVANSGSNNVTVFRNTSTLGTIDGSSFAAAVPFATKPGGQAYNVAIGDIDGDGKPDLAVANSASAFISVLRNTAVSGAITGGSFAPEVDFPSGGLQFCVNVADMDGDGLADIVTNRSPSVLRNDPLYPITGTLTLCSAGTTALTDATMGGTWSSDNTGVATASTDGTITGVAAGTANISYTVPGGSTSVTVTVNPTPNVAAIGNQAICNNAATTAVTFTGSVSATYTWTNSNSSIGLASSGTGDIASFTAINSGTVAVTATITVTPSTSTCTGTTASFVITVNPTPNVAAIGNQAICNNTATTAVSFTGSVAGTTYTWTNSNSSIGLASSGTGDIASFTAINSGTVAVTATVTVTPSTATCTGATANFVITVNPTPNVAAIGNQAICNNTATTAVSFTGSVAGTTYTWTNSNSSIGLATSGTGDIASFTAINSGTIAVTATVTVTPSTATCTGTTASFVITVNPTPDVAAVSNQLLLYNTAANAVTFNGSVAGTTYTWTNSNSSIGLATSGTGNIASFTAISTGTATVTVTPATTTCTGAAQYFTITVIDTPTIWYSDPNISGNNADNLTSWWSNNDGTGVNAVTFARAVDTFVMQNDMSSTSSWSIAGSLIMNAGTFSPIYDVSIGTAGVSGDLTMNGSSDFSGGNEINVTLYRNLSVNGSAGWNNPPAYTHIIFANTSSSLLNPQTISWSSTYSGIYASIVINSGVTVQLLTNVILPVGGDQPETINGTLVCNNFTLDANGNDVVMNSGGSLYTQNTGGVDATIINANSYIYDGAANYVFNGTALIGAQVTGTLTPIAITSAGSVTINNPAGVILSNSTNIGSGATLNLIAGTLTLGSNDFILGAGSTLNAGTFSNTLMFVTNGIGQLKNEFTADGSFMYPVGDGSGNYSPMTIDMTAGSYAPGNYAGVNVANAKEPNNANVSDYLNRYWTVSLSGIATPVYSVSAAYLPADVTGTEANLSTGEYAGTLPWIKYGTVNTTTHMLSATGMMDNGGDFTGITTLAPTVTASNDTTICLGTSAMLSVTASAGDPTLTYSWAPATDLSATTGTAVTATPSVTVTYTVTITDGNGFTNTAMTMVSVNPIPNVDVTADQGYCNSALTAVVAFTGSVTPTTYTWTNDNSNIGLANSGIGDIASFTATNVTSFIDSGNVIVTPFAGGCTGTSDTFKIIVYPTPNVVPTGDQAKCNGTATDLVTFSGAVSGTTYAWTNDNSTIGLASTGSGDIASFTATNTTSVTDTGNIVVTPWANGCAGPVDTFMITVYPTPNVVATADQAKCNNTPSDSVGFSGSVDGTTFAWTNDNSAIGLASAGTTNIPSFTVTNITTATDSATIIVLPSANGCDGIPDTFKIMVYPTPMLTSTLTPTAICSNTTFFYVPTTLTAGTTYAWTRNFDPNISGLPAAGTDTVNEMLVSISPDLVPVTYVYTLTANGCSNVQDVVVTVKPTPLLSTPLTNGICDSTLFHYAPASLTHDSAFTWVRPYVAGIYILPGSGVGAINDTLINTTNDNVVDTYYYTITAYGCSNTEAMTVVVHPTPRLSSSTGPFASCSGSSFDYGPATFTPGTTYAWHRAHVTGIDPIIGNGTGSVSEVLMDSLTTPQYVTYVYTLTANGCPHVEDISVRVNPTPAPVQITTSVSSVCDSTFYQNFGTVGAAPGYESYTWSATGATIISTGNMGQFSLVNFTTPGTSVITLTVTIDSTGCSSDTSVAVTVGTSAGVQPTVIYSFGEFICLQNDVTSYQWGFDNKLTLDSTILVGQINQSYSNSNPDTVHNYYWVMVDKDGCTRKAYYNAPPVVGISNANAELTEVKIYPNPTSDYVNVDVNTTIAGDVTVELTTMLGQKIDIVPAKNNKATIDVSKLASGIYIVDCYRDGIKIAAAKFIKN